MRHIIGASDKEAVGVSTFMDGLKKEPLSVQTKLSYRARQGYQYRDGLAKPFRFLKDKLLVLRLHTGTSWGALQTPEAWISLTDILMKSILVSVKGSQG